MIISTIGCFEMKKHLFVYFWKIFNSRSTFSLIELRRKTKIHNMKKAINEKYELIVDHKFQMLSTEKQWKLVSKFTFI